MSGFDTGSYSVTDGLAPTAATYTFRDLQSGGEYYWRILTRDGDGWVSSDTSSFTGPICVEDEA